MGNKNLLTFDDILTAVRNWKIHKRWSVLEVMKVIVFLHVNQCSSASGEQLFSTACRVKFLLRQTATKQRFNSVLILGSEKIKTKNLSLLPITNNFICNDDRRENFGGYASNYLKA